jgi:hypothetical protein
VKIPKGRNKKNNLENILEEKTIKKYLVMKYMRPHTSLKRNFLLRKSQSKDLGDRGKM